MDKKSKHNQSGGKLKLVAGTDVGKPPMKHDRGLTAKQEGFAQAVAHGANLSDAYRENYDADGMAPNTIWNSACKLNKNPKVSARVREIQAELEEDHKAREARLAEFVLKQLQSEAMEANTDGARVRALELIGKHVGLFTDKLEVEEKSAKTSSEIEKELERKLKLFLGNTG